MRIALTITELHPGGAEKCFVNLALFLRQHGHEVETWQLWAEPPADKDTLVAQLRSAGIQCHSVEINRAIDFPGGVWRLRQGIENYAPDVIQSFLFHANVATSLAGYRIAPIIGGVRVRQPQRWRGRLQKWISYRMEKLVCVSQAVQDHTAKVEGIHDSKLVVIPNGIDLGSLPAPRDDWAKFGVPERTPTILFVGRFDEQKGILEFLERAGGLLGKLPEHHLVLMGSGPQAQEVNRYAANLERVHVAGYQPDAQSWMQSASVVVLPARYEGMPNVIMEAMAGGTAVAAYDVEGIRELLGAGELTDAQIAGKEKFDELNQRIVDLCTSSELRQRCALHNRERIAQNFQLNAQFQKYVELYEAVCNSKD